jgi:hypothetical protein
MVCCKVVSKRRKSGGGGEERERQTRVRSRCTTPSEVLLGSCKDRFGASYAAHARSLTSETTLKSALDVMTREGRGSFSSFFSLARPRHFPVPAPTNGRSRKAGSERSGEGR